MKTVGLISALLIIFGLSHFLDSSSIPELDEASPGETAEKLEVIELPKFNFKDLSGKHHSISDYKGKIIILNFWASWCGPCEEEFPVMADIVMSNPNIVLIAISGDEERKNMVKFIKTLTKKFPNLGDSKVVFSHDKEKEISSELFNVLRLPETFIINKDLQIIKKVIGSQNWVNGKMKTFLEKLSN